jgi:hypothetical protein
MKCREYAKDLDMRKEGFVLEFNEDKLMALSSKHIMTHLLRVAFAAARAMISQDDDNQIMSAFWLPTEAPPLLILPPLRRVRSEPVLRLTRANRTVIPIWGQVAGTSSDDHELLANVNQRTRTSDTELTKNRLRERSHNCQIT